MYLKMDIKIMEYVPSGIQFVSVDEEQDTEVILQQGIFYSSL
jgi:hypothetical protein